MEDKKNLINNKKNNGESDAKNSESTANNSKKTTEETSSGKYLQISNELSLWDEGQRLNVFVRRI